MKNLQKNLKLAEKAVISPATAQMAACAEAGVAPEEARFVYCVCGSDGLYALDFCGDWMRWQAYVDAHSGACLGIMGEPLDESVGGAVLRLLEPCVGGF